jgi:hypothetical protein
MAYRLMRCPECGTPRHQRPGGRVPLCHCIGEGRATRCLPLPAGFDLINRVFDVNKNDTGRTAQEWCNLFNGHATDLHLLSVSIGMEPSWEWVSDDGRLMNYVRRLYQSQKRLVAEREAFWSLRDGELRLAFHQTTAWTGDNAYSDRHCCHCGKPTRPDAKRLEMSRTDDGEWWLCRPGSTALANEGQLNRFTLPVGPDCLRKHPQWRPAVTNEDS